MGFDFDEILVSPVVITAGIVWGIALVVSAAIFFIGSAFLGFLIPNAYIGWIALGLGMYISSWISLLDNNDWALVLASAVSTIVFSAVFILLMGAIFPDSFVLGDIFGLSPILAFAVIFLIILQEPPSKQYGKKRLTRSAQLCAEYFSTNLCRTNKGPAQCQPFALIVHRG